ARPSRVVRVRGLCVARVGRIGRWVVQWNAEPDLYSAAGDAHLLDQESEQPLPASEIELLETAANSLGKGGDAAAEAVVVGQLGSPGFQLRLLLLQLQPAAIYLWHSPLQLPQRENSGLIAVEEPRLLGCRPGQLALEASQLDGQDLVVAGAGSVADRLLAGPEQLGPEQGLADLAPDEGVQLGRPDGRLATAPVGSAGLDRVSMRADVVVEVGAAPVAHGADPAGAT